MSDFKASLTDPHTRDMFLGAVMAGAGVYEAAQTVGVSAGSYRYHYAKNPGFRTLVDLAKEAATEAVTKELRRIALSSEQDKDRIAAAKTYLHHQGGLRRAERQAAGLEDDGERELEPAAVAELEAEEQKYLEMAGDDDA